MRQNPRRRHLCAPLSRLTSGRAGLRYRAGMTPRTDLITASRIDLTLILMPAITWLEESVMLAASGVPAAVAARVLLLPGARRELAAASPKLGSF
jgi:hypothetical protein